MNRIIAAVMAAALAMAASQAANAATVIEIADGDIYEGGISFWRDFPAPDGEQAVQIRIEYAGVELLPNTSFYSDYRGLYYYWDDANGDVGANDAFDFVECSIANGCITIASPGLAFATFKAPRDLGELADCVPGSNWPCYRHLSPGGLSLFDGYVERTGGPAWVRVTIGDPTAVPEPATWAMMIIGFGVAGSALRRRKIAAA